MAEVRMCSGCGQVKDLATEFYQQKDGRGGYMSQCRACNNRRPPTTNRMVRNRARNRAKALLVERHREEFDTLFEHQLVEAYTEHDRLEAAAKRKGAKDAKVARIKPGPKRKGQTKAEQRLDTERCPNCKTHHAAGHECQNCGNVTPESAAEHTILGKRTPPYVVREWAYLNDIAIAPRGPIPHEVLVRYVRANRPTG